MSDSTKAERLRRARIGARFASASEAAERFGWTVSAYRHHENGTRNFGPDAAKRYGRAFKVKPGWLLGLDGVSEPSTADRNADDDRLDVNGSVAAGVWRESEHWNDDRRFMIDLPSPIPGAKRFGLEVEGLSMDLFYEPGAVLDCISIFDKPVKPATGDHVMRPDVGQRSSGARPHNLFPVHPVRSAGWRHRHRNAPRQQRRARPAQC